jgi:hypothetical protein
MKKYLIWIVLALSVIFTVLFYKQGIGINLVIYELIALPIMFALLKPEKFSFILRFISLGTLLSLIAVLMIHSVLSIVVHFIFLMMLPMIAAYPNFRSLLHAGVEAQIHIVSAQAGFVGQLVKRIRNKVFFKGTFKLIKIIFIPLAVIILFVVLYRVANPLFDENIRDFNHFVFSWLYNISFRWVGVFILGFLVTNMLLIKFDEASIYSVDLRASDVLVRFRKKNHKKIKVLGLKSEYRSAIILLIALNLLILYLNVIDINWFWFGFEWDGEFLKQFVHAGTWILVISILISMMIIVFYFRGNLNFYKKNKWLKRLSLIWLLQNVVMTISVVIRNLWYINYFGLAYKRIAVLFFLLLVLVGIATVIIKVYRFKTGFWLVRMNAYALFVVLLISSGINWDRYMAKYNFAHYERSFVHLNFLSRLSPRALPELVKSPADMQHISEVQQKTIPFDIENQYIDIYTYMDIVDNERTSYVKKQHNKHWLSWTPSDYFIMRRLGEQ